MTEDTAVHLFQRACDAKEAEAEIDRLRQLLDECQTQIRTLLAVVTIQNGNLYDDTNKIQADARALLQRLEGGKP